jgi:hypothetical protein
LIEKIKNNDEEVKDDIANLEEEDFFLWRSNRIRIFNNYDPELVISVRNSSLKRFLLKVFKYFEKETYFHFKNMIKLSKNKNEENGLIKNKSENENQKENNNIDKSSSIKIETEIEKKKISELNDEEKYDQVKG